MRAASNCVAGSRDAVPRSLTGRTRPLDPHPASVWPAHDRMDAGHRHRALGRRSGHEPQYLRPAGLGWLPRHLRDEAVVGWLMVGLGFLRIGGLIVNGARKNVTPWIRSVSASLGCCLF